ncbi:integrin alpha-M-like protein [Labeo rohita]|uniref:Integrin alpha-M-like protein n=1 Tax=Labeo rohita TaxID=84645 RepID=A0A498NDQ3_LABRO|nr:integrin alpha-M-like protein [Labeo rohita]
MLECRFLHSAKSRAEARSDVFFFKFRNPALKVANVVFGLADSAHGFGKSFSKEREILSDFFHHCQNILVPGQKLTLQTIYSRENLAVIGLNFSLRTGLRAAVLQLVSSASLDYDKNKYVFFSSDSQQTAPSVQINTQVEVYEEADLTKEIIGAVIGGLLVLAVITAALYKAGFFKSQYKQMLEEAQGDAGGQPNMPQ